MGEEGNCKRPIVRRTFTTTKLVFRSIKHFHCEFSYVARVLEIFVIYSHCTVVCVKKIASHNAVRYSSLKFLKQCNMDDKYFFSEKKILR